VLFLNFETDPKEGEMLDFLKRTIWLGVGLAAMTAEKIEETVRGIVKKGHLTEKEGKELIVDLVEKSKKARKDLGDRVEGMVQDTLKRLKIPTRKEVDELKARIEQLEKALEKKE
jgi:polyhydroxyalkanoate synthesis regulator phasin